jgi:hypothetical protein
MMMTGTEIETETTTDHGIGIGTGTEIDIVMTVTATIGEEILTEMIDATTGGMTVAARLPKSLDPLGPPPHLEASHQLRSNKLHLRMRMRNSRLSGLNWKIGAKIATLRRRSARRKPKRWL